MNKAKASIKISNYSGSQTKLAKKIGISKGHLSNILYGVKKAGGVLAVKIDNETNGILSKSLLRPDLWPPEQLD